MIEKNIQQTNHERFEFVLSVNGNIVCQRYFRINNFCQECESSTDLLDTLDKCVNLIKDDLRSKSNVYMWYMAPQVFKDMEEYTNWYTKLMSITDEDEKKHKNLSVGSYVVIEDTKNVYVWSGNGIEPYNGNYNVNEWIGGIDTTNQTILKFAFLDNGVEVCSREWDGSFYPRFIRNNIDISNSKNKYKQDGQFMPVESALIDLMNNGRSDLIPVIVRAFCNVCTFPNKHDYKTMCDYGNTEYDLNLSVANNKVYRAYEKKFKKKTDSYFKNLY